MKKTLLVLVALAVMAFSSVCSAAASGKSLDAEMALVDKFLAAKDYKQASSFMSEECLKNWDEKAYGNFKAFMDKEAGALTSKQLRVAQFLDDADVLVYQAAFAKKPEARYQFVFKNEKGKLQILDFGPQFPAPQAVQQAPAAK